MVNGFSHPELFQRLLPYAVVELHGVALRWRIYPLPPFTAEKILLFLLDRLWKWLTV